MENLQAYNSVAEVLRAAMNARAGRPLSIRQFSRKLGYASDRTLGMVIQGRREMGAEMLRRFADYAQLSVKDKEYLSLLALREKFANKGRPLQQVEEKLARFRTQPAASRRVSGGDLASLTAWYAFAVLEVLKFFPAAAEPAAIHKKLRGAVKLNDLKNVLRSLAELNFIKMTGEGCFRLLKDSEYVDTPVDIPSTTIRAIHRRQLERAIETLEEQNVSEREFNAKTFLVSAAKLPLFKKRVREMMEEIAEEFVASAGDADAVAIQFNTQVYQQSLKKD